MIEEREEPDSITKGKTWEQIQEMIKLELEAASRHYKELPNWIKRIEAKMSKKKDD